MNNSNKPTIVYVGRFLSLIVDEAEQCLIDANIGVYQRDGKLVRIGRFPVHGCKPSLEFVPIAKETLIELFTSIIEWQRAEGEKMVKIACPNAVAATYLTRSGHWHVPVIRMVITAPTMRADGSIISKPGYDKATGLYYMPQTKFAEVPDQPSKDDALAWLEAFFAIVRDVPFVDAVSRSVFLSAVLASLIRPMLAAVPLHGFSSPAPGSGKTILVNAVSCLTTGNPCSPITQGSEEETTKSLSSALQAGYSVVSFDNCEQPLGGAMLCQAVTEPFLSVRIFGKTELRKITNTAMYFATGNNLTFTGDIVRRALRSVIDAKCERPEMRKFQTPRPDLAMRDNRADLVVGGLTILRAFVVAGCPSSGLEPVGTFEDWSRFVRDCLIWLGLPDPWASTEQIRSEDPQIDNNIAALRAWFDEFADQKLTVKDAVDAAFAKTEGMGGSLPKYLRPALLDALRVVTDNSLSSQTLGCWLRMLKDRPFAGYTVKQATMSHGNNRWHVCRDDSSTESIFTS